MTRRRLSRIAGVRLGAFEIMLICGGLCGSAHPEAFMATAHAGTWTVPAERSLSATIAGAGAGDTLLVLGHHRESGIVVDRPLTILGRNGAVVEAADEGHIITVTASGVQIRGLTIRGAPVSFVEDYAGLLLESVTDCVVDSNRFEDNFFAVYLARSSGCRILDNVVIGSATSQTTSGNGIHLWYCRDTEIRGNVVRGHRDGVYFEFVKHSRIVDNLSEDNLRYGLHFMFSDSCRYERNAFIDNGAGVAVMYTHGVYMIGNRFERNWGSSSYGLLLKEISDSRVQDNVFIHNTIGIYMEGSNRVVVTENQIKENGWGVKIMANAIDNRFERNNFMDNSFQVSTNSRQNFSTFDGNYWSNYRGYDLDLDGTGDVPFRPVSLFSLVVESNPPTLVLMRSLAVDVLNIAEQLMPILTPETLVDRRPAMEMFP